MINVSEIMIGDTVFFHDENEKGFCYAIDIMMGEPWASLVARPSENVHIIIYDSEGSKCRMVLIEIASPYFENEPS